MNKDLKIRLYLEMQRIRSIEFAISKKYSEQEMRCPVHLSIGQEAIPVGISSLLTNNDLALSAHRSHAHYLAKGGSLKSMLSEIYGKIDGCAEGKGGSMHLFDLDAGLLAAVPIVGSTIPIAVGSAWGLKLKNQNNIVVVYFGDGSTEEGVFSESLDFASLKGLPILFVCENNLYSVYTRIETRQSQYRNIIEIAKAHGIESSFGDGNDINSVYEKSKLAKDYITQEKKPYFLEFSTFRWLEHCGPNWDDDLGYRKENELDDWMSKCPIKKLENQLLSEYIINNEFIIKSIQDINKEIEEAFIYAKDSKLPLEKELFKNIYS